MRKAIGERVRRYGLVDELVYNHELILVAVCDGTTVNIVKDTHRDPRLRTNRTHPSRTPTAARACLLCGGSCGAASSMPLHAEGSHGGGYRHHEAAWLPMSAMRGLSD